MKQLQVVILLGTLAALPAFSQTNPTAILGTVTDPSGAVMAGAKVTLLNTQTGIKRTETTTGAGDYLFPLLDPGVYSVTAEAAGFDVATVNNVQLDLNQKARIDFKLVVGTSRQAVVVSAQAALLSTDEATLGQVVNTQQITELPMNGRNLGSIAVLQPGVQYGGRMGLTSVNAGTGGGVPIPGDAISISANGQRDTDQHATLDGVMVTEARVNTVPFTPSPEAISEFKVLAGTYSAEYGTNAGAQLVMALRSGTNQYHGDLFEFVRNDYFDAETYFQNYFTPKGANPVPKSRLRQNQYGLLFSGPVDIPKVYKGKDRTFFMFDWEAHSVRQPGTSGTANYPTSAFESGDLSALLNRHTTSGAPLPSIQIKDPLTGTPFPNNQIPASRISPIAMNLFQFWPKAQFASADPITGYDYIGAGSVNINDDQRYVRVDHQFNDKDRIFGHYALDDIGYTQRYVNPNFPYFVTGVNQNAALQYVHIFGPALINEFRLGYMRSVDNTENPRTNTNFSVNALGMTGFRVLNDNNRPFTPREAGLPTISVSGFDSLAEHDGGNGYDFNNEYELGDNVSITRGTHTFKTGFQISKVVLDRGAANTPRGDMGFTDDEGGSGWASFLLGLPITSDTPEGLPLTFPRQWRYGFYFQDDWKFNKRLTLNLGLRYEYNTAAVDVKGLWRSLSFQTEAPAPASIGNPCGSPGLGCSGNEIPTLIPNIRTPYSFYQPDKYDFMPRIGLAYRLTDKTVIRSGGGLFYNVQQLNNYTILNLNPPLSGSVPFSNTFSNGILQNSNPITSQNPFGQLSPTSTINANTLNPNNPEPRVIQWSFDIQRQLPLDSLLTVGYVGSKGVHIDNTVELNNPDPGLSSLPTTPQQRRPWQYVIDGVGGPIRPLARVRWLDSGGNSWYHGLQVNYQKRISHGLQFIVAYTYSKALGEGYGRNESFGFVNGGSYQDPRDRSADKGPYPFDVRHNAVISGIYQLPSPFQNRLARQVLGGWQANGIWTIRTGLPFQVSQNNSLNTFTSPVRPDRICSGSVSNPTINEWFNPGCFQVVTCQVSSLSNLCHYGSSGNGILTGPGFDNVDFSLFKNFTIRENIRLQFRAEMFNILNHPNFNPPGASLNASPQYLPSTPGGIFPTQITGPLSGPQQITSTATNMRQMQFGLKLIF